MAKKAVHHKYEANRELRGIINQNIEYGLNTLEAIGDKAADVVEGVFNSGRNLSEGTHVKVDDFLKQTRKAYKDSFDTLRKQVSKALGSK